MPTLLDTSYFEGDLILPSISTLQAVYDNFIDDNEPDYLRCVLSPSLYDAFMAGLLAGDRSYFSDQFSDQFLHSPLDERWVWIRDGHTFTYNGQTVKWDGMLYTKNNLKRSPIAYYIYYQIRKSTDTFVSPSGEQKGSSENASNVSAYAKMVRVWNKMVDENRDLAQLITSRDVNGNMYYPELVNNQVCCHLFEYLNNFGI